MTVTECTPQVALKKILVATDFSKISQRALDYAAAFAHRYDASIDIVHIVNPETYVPVPMANGKTLSLEQVQTVLGTRLRDIASGVARSGIEVQTLLESGPLGKTMHRLVSQREIDLVVVGTHGGGVLESLMLGSAAEDIFREVPCPVFTVGPGVYRRPEVNIRFNHILYATDCSSDAAHAAPLAFALAAQHHASITLLHVLPGDMVSQSEIDLHTQYYRDQLRKLAPEGAERRLHMSFLVEQGSAGSVITQFANENGVDLIVLGAKKGSLLRSRLVSCTAYQAASGADCPVLTVRTR